MDQRTTGRASTKSKPFTEFLTAPPTFYPRNPAQDLGAVNVLCTWVVPPDRRDLSIQLNALSKKAWVQVILDPDWSLTGGGGPLLLDWMLQIFPTNVGSPYQGTAPLGPGDPSYTVSFGRIPQEIVAADEFYSGSEYIGLSVTTDRAYWAVYPAPGVAPSWVQEVPYSDSKYAEVPFFPIAVNIDVYEAAAYSNLVLKQGKVRFDWGASAMLAYVDGYIVSVSPEEVYFDGTGETSNLSHQVTMLANNRATQVASV